MMTPELQLRCHMNLLTVDSLPKVAQAPGGSHEEQSLGLRESGFSGVQFAGTRQALVEPRSKDRS